jgi:SGNH domain (fused to AT3 domains)
MAIFHIVERPIRTNTVFFSRVLLVRTYCVGVACTLGIAAFLYAANGLPGRFPPEAIRLASYANRREPDHYNCEFKTSHSLNTASDFCHIGDRSAKPTWLIYGDSHAWATLSIFDKWLEQHGASGLLIFQHVCTPLQSVHLLHDQGRCYSFNARIKEFLEANEDVKNVVLVSFWRAAVEGGLSRLQDEPMNKEESLDFFDESFAATVRSFYNAGRSVYIWEPVPGARMSVPTAMAQAAIGRNHKTNFRVEEYFSTYKRFFEDLKANRSAIAASFSPSNALCATGQCQTTISGNPAYFDNNHIATGSESFWINVLNDPVRGY